MKIKFLQIPKFKKKYSRCYFLDSKFFKRRFLKRSSIFYSLFLKFLISVLIFFWIFSGWPQIWLNPRIPPEIKKAQAAVNWTQCRTEGGETTIPASADSANVTLDTAITDTSQAFLLVDSSGASGVNGGDDHMVSGYIANTTTLTFQRGAAPATAVYITYQLVECFNNEFSVQRGETVIGSGASSNTATISSVDTTRSIVIVSVRSSDTAANEQTSLVTGELQNATTVLVRRQSAPTVTATVRWEVVTFSTGSGASVQTGEVTLASGASSVTDTITSVDTSRSWLYCSWDAANNGLRQTTLGCELTNSTTVTIYRYSASNYTNRIRYYVIEFPANGVTVQRGNVLFNTGTCTDGTRCDKDITITAVSATTKAFPFVTNTVSGTGTAYPRNKWIEQLTSTTNLRLSNWRFSGTAAYATQYWQVIEFPQPPTFQQSAYRWFNNLDSTDVGSPLAAQDTAATLGSAGEAFRLRMLLHIGTDDLPQSGENFKLQFAQRGSDNECDTSFSGETYADVTAATAIAYKDNPTPADGAALTANANDPTDGYTAANQTYEEANPFTNSVSAITTTQSGKWDFALKDNGAPLETTYCFRVVKSNNGLLDSYTVIPQITTASPIIISGIVYQSDESTPITGTPTIKLAVGTTIVYNTTVSSGNFSFDSVSPVASGTVMTIWLDTAGSPAASLVFKYGSACTGYPNCTGLSLYENRVNIDNKYTGNITNSDLAACDNDSGGSVCGDTDIGFTSNGGVLTLTFSTNMLRIASGVTFAPGGNVNCQKLRVASGAIYSGGSETLTLSGSGTGTTCGLADQMPLCVNGTYIASSNTTKFTGGSASLTALNSNFNNLDLAASSSTTYILGTASSQTLTVGGDLNVGDGTNALTVTAATYNPNLSISGATTIKNNATLIIGTGTNTFNDITINSGGAWDNSANANVTVNGSLTNNQIFTSGSGTYTLAGSNKSLDGTLSFATVSVSGSYANNGTLTIDNLAISNSLINNSALTVSTALTGAGTLTNATDATLNLSGSISIDNLNATASPNIVVYNGTSSQTIKNTTYHHLTINNANGADIGGDVTVNGTLTLSNGIITTNNNAMIISSTGNVSRTNGHINGNFQKYIATGPTSKTFEVGDASDYAPVSVVFGNVSSAGNLTAKTTDNDHPDIANSGIDPAKSVNRYWTMTKDANLAFSTYSATFYFVAGDIDSGADWNNFIVAKKNGSWTKPAVGERTSTSIQALNMDSFSDYQIGESSAAITLTLSTSTVDLGILVPQIPITATTTATVFVSGYNNGYYLAIKRDSSTSTLALQSNPIIIFPDYSPGWDPTANGGNGNATTTPGLTFSFRLMSSGTDSNYNSNWWGLNDNEGTAKFAGMPLTTQTIMTCSSLVCQNGTTTNVILYRADAPLIQPIGIYSGDITITALGNP